MFFSGGGYGEIGFRFGIGGYYYEMCKVCLLLSWSMVNLLVPLCLLGVSDKGIPFHRIFILFVAEALSALSRKNVEDGFLHGVKICR